ncbi:hypothetical protein CEB3_c20050 [Peptococcaceae bacterium CEB3]|nr:hypothetical protein CEB3_c20050 [Peptococcaceae bacterium CEB3]
MNSKGIFIGLIAFIIIGAFHPIVIKSEYYFSKRIWPLFLLSGLLLLGVSLLIHTEIGSAIFGITGFTCLWSIKELREQEERVKKGWFPGNPNKRK